MGKQDNAGRFECGCLNVTTENLTSWTWSRREKPLKICFRGALKTDHFKKKVEKRKKNKRKTIDKNREKMYIAIKANHCTKHPVPPDGFRPP